MDKYPFNLLGALVRFDARYAHFWLPGGYTGRMLKAHFWMLFFLWPNGKLFVGSNGRGRTYLRLRPGNHMAVRLCAVFGEKGNLQHEQIKQTQGLFFDCVPSESASPKPGRGRGSDRTFQAVMVRMWSICQHRNISITDFRGRVEAFAEAVAPLCVSARTPASNDLEETDRG